MASNPASSSYEINEMKDYYDEDNLELYDKPDKGDDKPFADGLTLDYKHSSVFGDDCLPKLSFIVQLLTLVFVIIGVGVGAAILHKTYQDAVEANDAESPVAGSSTGSVSDCDPCTETILSAMAQNNSLLHNQMAQVLNATQGACSRSWSTLQTNMELIEQLNYTDTLNKLIQTSQGTADKLSSVVSTLSNLEQNDEAVSAILDDIFVIVEELLLLHNASSIFDSITPVSCEDIKNVLPNSQSGYYHVNSRNIYCNMDNICGSDKGWTRIAYLDLADSTQNCPSGLKVYSDGSLRTCGRASYGCDSTIFDIPTGLSYSEVCGKVKAYQRASTDGIAHYSQGIDSYYVDGVSITRGSPRQHLWTLISGLMENHLYGNSDCPCYPGSNVANKVPSFIGNDYYCESGNPGNWVIDGKLYSDDVLWDGQDCTTLETNCCSNPNLPWFHKALGSTTTDFIEMRLCGSEPPGNAYEDARIFYYEIYIK